MAFRSDLYGEASHAFDGASQLRRDLRSLGGGVEETLSARHAAATRSVRHAFAMLDRAVSGRMAVDEEPVLLDRLDGAIAALQPAREAAEVAAVLAAFVASRGVLAGHLRRA